MQATRRYEAVLLLRSGVLTIKRRLIIGTLIAYGVAAATTIITIPTVTVELGTNVQVQTVEAHSPSSVTEVKGIALVSDNQSVEETVRSYFKDIPIMIDVARCESGFTHYDPHTGEVKRGHMNAQDLGVMQINEYYHGTTAKQMGLILSDINDNLAYARYLYEREGTKPWSASEFCWEHNLLAIR